MSYPSNNNEWQSDRFNGRLEAPLFDDFETYFETQIAGPSSPPKRPIPSSSNPNSWCSDASSSLNESSSFPSSAWTPNASSLDFHSVSGNSSQNSLPPSAFAPLTQNDYAFLANIDPTLLAADLANVTANHSIPTVSEPLGHSSRSRKRPRANEEPEGPNNASIDAFSNLKRRRLFTDGHQTLPNVPPPRNTYNNVMTNTFNDFSLPASIPRANTTLSSTPYPDPQIFHGAPAYSVPIPSALPVLLPPVHVGARQPGATAPYRTAIDNTAWWNPNADFYTPLVNLSPPQAPVATPAYLPGARFCASTYPGNEGTVDYTLGSNGNGNGDLYNSAAGTSDALPDAENRPLDWTTGLLGPEYFYNTTAVASVGSSSVQVVPPFLEQQTPVYHTNGVVNNTTHSSVVDFRQHSGTTHQISTTEHVANATIPNTHVPSTSGAPSVDPLAITYELIEPSTPPSSPSPTRKRPKKREPTLYPDEKLWFLDKDKKYVCQYKGPARPKGCKQKSGTPRNLGRHMRKHAKSEAGMRDLSPNERVAINGMPEGLLRVKAECRLANADLHQCAFYREHGRRWVVMTMERRENLERKHRDRDHDVDQQQSDQRQSPPQKKRKKV